MYWGEWVDEPVVSQELPTIVVLNGILDSMYFLVIDFTFYYNNTDWYSYKNNTD